MPPDPRPPLLTPDQCTVYIERERLTAWLALRSGYVQHAYECGRFVWRMRQHRERARRALLSTLTKGLST